MFEHKSFALTSHELLTTFVPKSQLLDLCLDARNLIESKMCSDQQSKYDQYLLEDCVMVFYFTSDWNDN